MHNLRQRAVRLGDYMNLAFFIFWLSILSHWFACGWIALTFTNEIPDEWNLYVSSLYWVIQTFTTVGYGDVPSTSNAQMIYSMLVMLFGVGVYGYVIGNVANILSKKDPGKAQFFENMDKLKSFVRYRNIPPELQKRILNYYIYIWKKRLGFNETSFMEGLPSGLRTEVEVFLKRDVLKKIPLFKGVDDKFLKEVSLHLRPVVYTPGDFIFKEGDLGNEMHFVIRGRLEVLSGDGMIVYSELSDGDFFGEIALFKNRPRTASIRAITFSDLYILDKEAFEVVLKNYPDIASHIKTIAEQREDRSSKPEVGY
jgi:voltage-gated potassium channel